MSKRVCKEDQIRLIMECRQSGLSDFQWCEQNGVYPGNFYNWVSKLRKSGYTFPESAAKSNATPNRQEVEYSRAVTPQVNIQRIPDDLSGGWTLQLTIVEMAKAYNLNLYEYLKYLLEHRPNKDMADDELAKLAPWSEEVQEKCSKQMEQNVSVQESQ